MNAVDHYLAHVKPEQRRQLERIRTIAKEIVPSAEETISYKMPTLKYRGEAFLGFAARAGFIGLYPYSGSVLTQLKEHFRAYRSSTAALRIPDGEAIPRELLELIIAKRLESIA